MQRPAFKDARGSNAVLKTCLTYTQRRCITCTGIDPIRVGRIAKSTVYNEPDVHRQGRSLIVLSNRAHLLHVCNGLSYI